jgi:hypothetical protein
LKALESGARRHLRACIAAGIRGIIPPGEIRMKIRLTAIVIAAAFTVGSANAATGFGSSSHRLGGDSSARAAKDSKPLTLIEAVLGLIGFDFAASVEPVASEAYADRTGKPKECEQAKKTEVAKAESKEDEQGGASKGRTRTGEPVYLAF